MRTLGKSDLAFICVFDNCNFAATVRDERLHNKSDFISYTVGFAVEPARPRPMFSRSVADYRAVASLRISDFLPSAADMEVVQSIFCNLIMSTLKRFCNKWRISLPKLDFPMPDVRRINHKVQPKVRPFRTFDLDESQIDDLIEVDYRMGDDVGLTEEQIKTKLLLYVGDFFTVVNQRYV